MFDMLSRRSSVFCFYLDNVYKNTLTVNFYVFVVSYYICIYFRDPQFLLCLTTKLIVHCKRLRKWLFSLHHNYIEIRVDLLVSAKCSLRASSRARGLGFCWGEVVGGGKRISAMQKVFKVTLPKTGTFCVSYRF